MDDIDYSRPFRIRILQDCRKEEEYGLSGKLDGHYGMCLGLYDHPNIWKENSYDGNPLILTDSEDYIWGLECWFDPNPEENKHIPLDLQQKALGVHKANIRKQIERRLDE